MFYVWWSSTQPKAKMIGYLDSAHQNSWKTLFSVIHMLSHIRNYFLTNFTAMTQWWFKQQKHLLFYVWWSSTQSKAKMIWYLDSAHQNSWKTLLWSHTWETNFQPTLQQWQNDGSSNKNTYYFMFDYIPLNQEQIKHHL